MNPETVFWHYIRRHVSHVGRWQRIEEENVPDVYYALPNNGPCYVSGWIELKQLDAWPKREDTIVKIDHFTKGQRNWIIDTRQYAPCYLFLKVGRGNKAEYLLYGDTNIELIGTLTRIEMYTYAYIQWHGQIDFKEFLDALE